VAKAAWLAVSDVRLELVDLPREGAASPVISKMRARRGNR
jgi:hypothetical protein